MPSIVTTKYRVKNAKEFVEALGEQNDNFYLFFGRVAPWSSGADFNSSNVPVPDSSTEDTLYEYWRDMLGLVRLTPNNVSLVVNKNLWRPNASYTMYDHRLSATAIFSTTTPSYVVNANNEVFRCLYNGRYPGGNSISTEQPTTTGLEDITKLITTSGTPYPYVWKYLYKIDGSEATKYLTPQYMPVKSVINTLETVNTSPTFGDIYDDGSDQYDIFNDARTSNGAIYTIVVENGGSNYSQGAQAVITGDGSGAQAVTVVDAGQIKQVNMVIRGSNYSYANVTFVDAAGGGSGAVATPIISPRSSFTNALGTYYVTNHSIDIEQELNSSRVMIYVTLENTGSSGTLPVDLSYRRVGIVRNPILYGTNTIATGTEYSQTVQLQFTDSTGLFTQNEIVFQNKGAGSYAYGVVAESQAAVLKLTHVFGTFELGQQISGIGNGDVAGYVPAATINIPATPEAFTPLVPASGTQATVSGVILPDITPFSGDILMVDHKVPVKRDPIQLETIRFVLSF